MGSQRALVADDDLELLGMVSTVLEKLGIDVVQASSGELLLETLADRGPFDLIITDVAMPRMTGLQVMHSARAAGLPVPVIVMTALRDGKTSESTLALGEHAILLHKPFTISALRMAVRSSLGMTPADQPVPA